MKLHMIMKYIIGNLLTFFCENNNDFHDLNDLQKLAEFIKNDLFISSDPCSNNPLRIS